MRRPISAILMTVALVVAGLSSAAAQSAQGLASGRGAYHAAICPGPSDPGSARCHAHVVTDKAAKPIESAASPNVAPSGYGPAELRLAYNMDAAGTAYSFDSAPIIAIVDAYGYNNAETDLAVYRAQFGLPACTTKNGCFSKYNQNGVKGAYPRQDTGWAQETALDLDMASAMCPTCRIILVQASSNSFANLATAVNTAAALGATVISNSYGGGESGSQAYESAYNHLGVAITVSSGDYGYGVQFPASSPHVTAVGGTSLTPAGNARKWSESAWSGAGSGCSALYAKPAWQADAGCAQRTVADVSAVADPATGVAVYAPVTPNRSGWLVFGGTSVGAPLIGGIYAANGGGALYGSDPYYNSGFLNDVVTGSNGSCGGSYLCTAKTGYDGPTGLGSPNGVLGF